MKGRIIQTKFWADSFIWELDPIEKLLFFYYICNPDITILHVYECADRQVLYDTKVTQEQLTTAKNKFQVAGKIHFFKDWIYISNASRYQQYKGPDNEKAKEILLRQLPKEVLDWYYNINDTSVYTPVTHPVIVTVSKDITENVTERGVSRETIEKSREVLKEKGVLPN